MITKRTKIQLVIFVVITLLGVSLVGAKYAQLDRLFCARSYTVDAHFADSGGIFAGAEVTYRGVTIGRVGGMELTGDGRRRDARHRQRRGPTSRPRPGPWSATARPWASSTSSCSPS